jgi:hypothetical protein
VTPREPVQVRFTLRLRDQRSMWMQDGCKVYVDSYVASNGSCFMVTWIIFKKHLLEVGLTQNRETMALRTLTSVGLFYFYHVWEPAWTKIHWNGIWLRAWSHMTSHYTWTSVTTPHAFEGVSGRSLDTFFWALTISWSRLLAHVWSGPYYMLPCRQVGQVSLLQAFWIIYCVIRVSTFRKIAWSSPLLEL